MRYLYEFLGTFFLVLTIGLTVIPPNDAGPLAPVAIGFVLAAMVYAGAHISDAHYNPAISLAVYLRGRMSLADFGYYALVQILGGIIAGLVTIYLKGVPMANPLNFDILRAFLAEFLFTFALCFTVLNVATVRATKGNSFFGFGIGAIVLAGAYAVGAISGAAFNPAVAVGITVMNLSFWSNLWVYFVACLAGGAVSALIFNRAHPKET